MIECFQGLRLRFAWPLRRGLAALCANRCPTDCQKVYIRRAALFSSSTSFRGVPVEDLTTRDCSDGCSSTGWCLKGSRRLDIVALVKPLCCPTCLVCMRPSTKVAEPGQSEASDESEDLQDWRSRGRACQKARQNRLIAGSLCATESFVRICNVRVWLARGGLAIERKQVVEFPIELNRAQPLHVIAAAPCAHGPSRSTQIGWLL